MNRHATPARWFFAVVCVALLAGCATSVPRTRYLQQLQPSSMTNLIAFRSGTNLEIRISRRPTDVLIHASWPRLADNATNYQHRFAVLGFDKENRPVRKATATKTNRVVIRNAQQWRQLVQRVFANIVPARPGHGVLLLVQNEEVVVFRDAAGKLSVVKLENKPANIAVDRTYNDTDFSRQAIQALEAGAGDIEAGQRQFLFVTGEDPAFAFVDLQQRLIVFLSYPGDPETQELPPVFVVRALNSLLIRSLLVTAIKNPFTLIARGFWHLGNAGAMVIDSGAGGAAEPPPPLSTGPGMDLAAWEKDLDHIVSAPRYKGRLDLLIDGEKFFPALIESIEGATNRVDMMVFIFDTDDYAIKIADLLKKRSSSVKVRVLIDEAGSLFGGGSPPQTPVPVDFQRPADIKQYLTDGSRVKVRASANPWLTVDHRKCFIIDSRQAFIGGMNLGRQYRYDWHDMMISLTGPVVGRLEKDYREAWAHAGPFGDFAYAWVSIFDHPSPRKNEVAGAIDIRPLRTATGCIDIYRAQLEAIERAQSYIYIENAYFDDDTMLRALIRARRRGVDVRVVFPAENDSGIMQTSDQIAGNELIENGVRVFVYPGMTHVKAAIYDGWACVGSANFNKMSLRVGQELDAAFSDSTTVLRLKRDLFEADFKRSRELKSPVPLEWFDSFVKAFADQL